MFENFNQPLDIYCERLTPTFWAEPVNAITNLAFLAAAYFAYRLCRKSGFKSRDMTILITLATVVGIGSFIFHTVATKGAMLADIIPIGIFIFYALYLIFTRIFALNGWQASFGLILFAIFNILVLNIFGRAALNGSIQYMPTFLTLLAIAVYSYIRHYIPSREFFISALVFLAALTCRSIDQQICPEFPLGTHFLWHILNSIAMYYTMKGIIRSSIPKP